MSGSQISTVAGLYAHCGARMLPVYKHSNHFCDSLLPKRHRGGEIDVKFQQLSRFLRSMRCLGSGAKIGASSFTRGGCPHHRRPDNLTDRVALSVISRKINRHQWYDAVHYWRYLQISASAGG